MTRMLGCTGLRAGLIFVWKGMVLTSMEMAGSCSPCATVSAMVIWMRSIRGGVVRAIKVYALGMSGDVVARKSYRGLAAGSVGIGSLVSDFLGFTELHFDEAEEWLCSGGDYGVLEISGWGVPIEDEPEQVVTAICVVA
ncbi:hypothetical protein [Stenotrophomonas sp. DDT-1]|uniref:hypothetical protein n=1 Tax=Stenotrophomonas sp. DDT-1 TaxID=1609637 RepID=UPI001F52A5FA|nr:hypothetical protein [Stenotrophomonas sp. DDT-1]